MRLVSVLLACLFLAGCSFNSSKKEAVAQKEKAAAEFRTEEKKLDREIDAAKKEAEKKTEALKKELEEIPEIHIDTGNVTFEWAGEKGKTMSCRAERFSGSRTDEIVTLEGFSADMNDKQASFAAHMIAPKAVLYMKTRKVAASGGVKVTSATNKAVLVAERVEWDSKAGKMYAENARLSTDMGVMTGRKMTLDTALETFEVSDR